ncbi:type I-F CRISPR-associated protein Csy2 [Nitrosovibrio sp. Nv4]|uniref:type I-F CRISPR-associated protein Csy2 n=1 Tax=Nitrosovibrio sp. Nv4 TaxID=1945880 RepID=UPI000BC373EC|nr:type I-F CRISPR-associated protein Csy2 [Nitrosovibrio sp. Nv4]SOD41654.1 CRISPR-associated protein, Csy2 family [Nitrosovibrio sp. Nv4]
MAKLTIDTTALLLLPRLRIQNANAISGPLSWGFPSPAAFTGFVHALERKSIERNFCDLFQEGFGGIGIICHRFDPQVSEPSGRRNKVFCLARHPLDKDGDTAAFVEEGRAHMEISLVIAVRDYLSASKGKYFAEDVLSTAYGMRLAGGSLLPPQNRSRQHAAQWWPVPDDLEGQAEVFRKLRRRLLPGFALVQREDLLIEHLAEMRARHLNSETTPNTLDALLDLSRLNIEPGLPNSSSPGDVQWGIRKRPGWLVPLPVGYGALSPVYAAGEVKNTRDDTTPFRFVESLYSLGEWVSPHRLENLEQLFWHAESEPENGIYRCINRYSDYLNITRKGTHKEK